MAINWNEAYTSGRDYRVMNQLLLTRILGAVDKTEGQALDIGCGTGDLAVKLARRGYTVTAIDMSEVAIAKARQRAVEARVGEKTTFIVGDVSDHAQAQPLEDKQYDLITCKLVFAFIQDKPSFLDWVKQHLAPAGTFVLITPVLHPDIDYLPRLRNISVPYEELLTMLKAVFSEITELHQEYFDEWGDERTFVLRAR